MFHELAYVSSYKNDEGSEWCDLNPKLSRNRSTSTFERYGAKNAQKVRRQSSLVVGQKLRESKWFTHEEIAILCAVLESGFILQKKDETTEDHRGIALWAPGYEKSKNPDYITIYTVCLQKGQYKVQASNLLHFWAPGTSIKINNQSDQTSTPNVEEVIRSQITYAISNKHKWHNSEHFTYWCRYGTPQKDHKAKMVSESSKWGNFGLNAGFFFLKNRRRSASTSN